MKTTQLLLPLAATLAIILGACSQGLPLDTSGSSAPAGNGFSLAAGRYDFVVGSLATNGCWAPPKAVITTGMATSLALTVGSSASYAVATTNSLFAALLDGTVNQSTDSLAGTSSHLVPASQLGLTSSLGCTLFFQSVTLGALTTNNAFNATVTTTVSETTASQCQLAVGSLQPQFDALPCSVTFTGSASIVTFAPTPTPAPSATPTHTPTPTPTPTADPTPTPNPCTIAPTLSALQAQVFTPICAGCHGAGSPTKVVLNSAANVLASTVGVTATEALSGSNGKDKPLLVDAGSHAKSYLWMKVTDASDISGGAMPLNGTPLTACQVFAIAGWIDAGAHND